MDFSKLAVYLKDKEDRWLYDSIAVKALKDEDFEIEENILDFIEKDSQLVQVTNNPTLWDRNATYKLRLKELIYIICTAYNVFLYEKKGKFTSLNESIEDVEKRIKDANTSLKNIEKTSNLIEWAELLDSYSTEFKTRSSEYDTEADKRQKYLIWSFIGFWVTFVLLIFINILDFEWIIGFADFVFE